MIWLCRLGKRPAFTELLSVVTQWSRCYIHSLTQRVIILFTKNDWQRQLREYDYTSSSCCTFTDSKLRSCQWLSAVSVIVLRSFSAESACDHVESITPRSTSTSFSGIHVRISSIPLVVSTSMLARPCVLVLTSALHMSRPAHTSDGPSTHFQH